jgi:hypothetical protein
LRHESVAEAITRGAHRLSRIENEEERIILGTLERLPLKRLHLGKQELVVGERFSADPREDGVQEVSNDPPRK